MLAGVVAAIKLATVIDLLVVVDKSYIINSSSLAGVAPIFVWPTISKPTTGTGPDWLVTLIPFNAFPVAGTTPVTSPVVTFTQLPAPSKY